MSKKTYSERTLEEKTAQGGRLFAFSFGKSGVVSIEGSIEGGYGRTPNGNGTIAGLHAAMLTEGTKKRTKKQIQLFLDSIGASVSFSASFDRVEFSARARTEHLAKVLDLIVECLLFPTFPQKELVVIKSQAEGALAQEAENTRTQASISFLQLLFEKKHPNYQRSTIEKKKMLAQITRESLVKFHKETINGKSLIVAIAGDVPAEQSLLLAKKYFNKLPNIGLQKLSLPKVEGPTTGGTAIAHVPGKASIDYFVGLKTGLTKKAADFPALLLGLRIFGNPSGFTGRLMQIVREKEGLTYGTGAYLTALTHLADTYIAVWGTFAPQLFAQGRKSIRRELLLILKNGPTEIELKKHKRIFEASWHVRLSSSSAFANAIHDTIAEGYELTELDDFPEKINKVTLKEVSAALKKYVNPKKLSEAAAGTVEKNALR